MSDEYGKLVIAHYKIQNDALWELMSMAQRLCPGGEWVFQMFARADYNPETPKTPRKRFMATVTNGDDNVTAIGSTPGAAVALLIHYLLDGSVFPLTGNGGRKIFPADNGWTRDKEEQP